jgi:septum formation protein
MGLMDILILGSQSPRRKEILEYFKVPFRQIASNFDEESVLFNGDPADYVTTLAIKKSQEISQKFPESLILTADTTVYCAGKIYNKPQDLDEARKILQELCGVWNTVYTGIALRRGKEIIHGVETTRILLNPFNLEQINSYLTTNQWKDKAGGYAVQEGTGILVNKIDGCTYNAMGLPINTLTRLFKEFKITFK